MISGIDHIILYSLLFVLLIIYSNLLQKNSRKIRSWTLVLILFFSFIEGFRYGRGQDYIHYKDVYEGIDITNDSQLIFNIIQDVLHLFYVNYVGYFVCTSFFFISTVFYFIKSVYKVEGRWMFILSVLAMLPYFECFIRQYIAMSFLFLGLCYINRGGKSYNIWAILMLIIISLTHTGLLFCIPFLVISYFYIKNTIPLKISLPLLMTAYFLIPEGFFSGTLIDTLNTIGAHVISSDNPMSIYLENTDRWFGEDSVISAAEQSAFTKSLQFMFELSVIVLGYYAIKLRPNQNVLFLYNIVLIGFVFCRIFHGYEIFQRLFTQLYVFWFVPAGYALSVIQVEKWRISNSFNCLKIYLILYLVLFWGRFIIFNPDAMYVWNL